MTFRKSVLVIIAWLTLLRGVSARTWTTVTGQHFEAEFVRVEGANGIFSVKGKDYPYALNQLSVPDRLFVGRSVRKKCGAIGVPRNAPPETLELPAATAQPARWRSRIGRRVGSAKQDNPAAGERHQQEKQSEHRTLDFDLGAEGHRV
jgi:hypothetical protein